VKTSADELRTLFAQKQEVKMSNLYLNKEQQEHMEYLAKIPRDKKCECGWYLKTDAHAADGRQACVKLAGEYEVEK